MIAKRVMALLFAALLLFFSISNIAPVTDTIAKCIRQIYAGERIDAKEEISLFTKAYGTDFSWKYDFIDANGLAHLAMGQRLMNETLKLDNGKLTFISENTDPSENAASLIRLDEALQKMDTELLYVQLPAKTERHGRDVPAGSDDYANAFTDAFVSSVRQAGVIF